MYTLLSQVKSIPSPKNYYLRAKSILDHAIGLKLFGLSLDDLADTPLVSDAMEEIALALYAEESDRVIDKLARHFSNEIFKENF